VVLLIFFLNLDKWFPGGYGFAGCRTLASI